MVLPSRGQALHGVSPVIRDADAGEIAAGVSLLRSSISLRAACLGAGICIHLDRDSFWKRRTSRHVAIARRVIVGANSVGHSEARGRVGTYSAA